MFNLNNLASSILLSLPIAIVSVAAANPAIAAPFEVTYKETQNWGSGMNGQFTIKNTGTETIQNWKVTFTWNSAISSIWDGTISAHTGNNYTITNNGWNGNIAPGASVSFGIGGTPAAGNTPPSNFNVNGLGGTPSVVISNPDFEQGMTGLSIQQWQQRPYEVSIAAGQGVGNSKALVIDHGTATNDTRVNQTITGLTPGKGYVVSGWMKGENVTVMSPSGSTGANVTVNDQVAFTKTGTFDWTKFEGTFFAQDSSAVLAPRLGYYGSDSTGKAYFDNITIQGDAYTSRNSPKYFTFNLQPSEYAAISDANWNRWMTQLDTAYEIYADLVGGKPFNGARSYIQSVKQFPGGWAIAGNPIQWYGPRIPAQLERNNSTGEWSFGILHEIGHNFDLDYRWSWGGDSNEVMANFKMQKVLEDTNALVYIDDSTPLQGGVQMKNWLYNLCESSNTTCTVKGDHIVARLVRIKDQMGGWNAFKQTFREISALPAASVPSTKKGRFDLFVDTLTRISGLNVRAQFTAAEMAYIVADYSN
ncbi:cellulose binding domain-containing protein [Chitinolyticbacter albus]|uniref:cellulose binding domain-containing protein n=1 Tax=Chitinolyticbacter albus TaxID=2961951 RepID=UPI00210DAA2E|nr:cellulose binding domain-containing protein [Chitinolyticbacter albus]